MQETRNNCFGSKNVAQPFFRRKQLSTSAEKQQQRTSPCHISGTFLHVFLRAKTNIKRSSQFTQKYGTFSQCQTMFTVTLKRN